MSSKKFLIACDTFKGTLPSYKVGEAFEVGVRNYVKQIQHTTENLSSYQFLHAPMSDGGAGLLDSVTYSRDSVPTEAGGGTVDNNPIARSQLLHLKRVRVPSHIPITGPLGSNVNLFTGDANATVDQDNNVGVHFACDTRQKVILVEMAAASGLPLIAKNSDRNIYKTTSYGTGELVEYALRYVTSGESEASRTVVHGSSNDAYATSESNDNRNENHDDGVVLFLGIGGSATNDGGLGALQALGLNIYVKDLNEAEIHAEKKDENEGGVLLTRPFRGEDLMHLTRVEFSDKLKRLFYRNVSKSPISKGAERPDGSSSSKQEPYIKKVYLLCDVSNPLVGPAGATFVYGPQKCSVALKESSSKENRQAEGASADIASPEVQDDGKVGAIATSVFQEFLQTLDTSMGDAAARIVNSSYAFLNDSLVVEQKKTEQEWLQELLHAPGGGGAGGMSGFFRYVLQAVYLPGADAVASLVNVRYAPTLLRSLGMGGQSGGQTPMGYLQAPGVSVLVSGEGSFDTQTIYYHKTVGRLLEMSVEVNVEHSHSKIGTGEENSSFSENNIERKIKSILVLCGKCGYDSEEECYKEIQTALVKTLLSSETDKEKTTVQVQLQELLKCLDAPKEESEADLKGTFLSTIESFLLYFIPDVKVIALTPEYSTEEAMRDPFNCLTQKVEQFFLANEAP